MRLSVFLSERREEKESGEEQDSKLQASGFLLLLFSPQEDHSPVRQMLYFSFFLPGKQELILFFLLVYPCSLSIFSLFVSLKKILFSIIMFISSVHAHLRSAWKATC
jgi:hypothetical protein